MVKGIKQNHQRINKIMHSSVLGEIGMMIYQRTGEDNFVRAESKIGEHFLSDLKMAALIFLMRPDFTHQMAF